MLITENRVATIVVKRNRIVPFLSCELNLCPESIFGQGCWKLNGFELVSAQRIQTQRHEGTKMKNDDVRDEASTVSNRRDFLKSGAALGAAAGLSSAASYARI